MTDLPKAPPFGPVYWLALGTFAIGAEGFMIVPLLPKIAADLSVSIATAGQLITVFTLAYALSSPLLTVVTGAADRRRLLIGAMVAFAVANVVAFVSRDYAGIMAARILLALAAGLYVPNANALAGSLVSPDHRGRALAIVSGGTTAAIALGLPLGAVVGDRFGWRMTFAGVGALAALAVLGLVFGLSRQAGLGAPVAGLGARLAVARQPSVILSLLVTTLWATGAYTMWTFIAPYLFATTLIGQGQLGAVVFAWGASAAVGVTIGGALSDRLGPRAVLLPALAVLILAFLALTAIALWTPRAHAAWPVIAAIIIWGLSSWGFFPAQVARLIGVAGQGAAPVALSLNASFMFLGFAAGAALGGVVVTHGPVADLGLWAAGLEVLALALVAAISREDARPAPQASAQPIEI